MHRRAKPSPAADRSRTCAACGDQPTVTSMADSEAFAARHGLTVGRRVPDVAGGADLPTVTCEASPSRVFLSGRPILVWGAMRPRLLGILRGVASEGVPSWIRSWNSLYHTYWVVDY